MKNKIECEKAVGEICEMCFKKHELEYGHQPINCAFREFDNEDCPTVKVLKDLIQEHFEEEETNAEHYLNDLLKIGMNFCFMHGKVKNCCDVGCAFCTFGKANCDKERFKWLASPYKKPPYKLTKFENDLLQSYLKCHLSGRKFKSILVLNWMKEKGYFKDIDENATIVDILEKCEVI